ncbi:Ff.00g022690.m01.CDS01 [Fusarium sp. VM40]|nr:Ff.00g022690.m01.CDS01 [Fusarium sp. VM40]
MTDKTPYKYQPLETPLHIRLMHLLPGKQGENIRMQISHVLLEKPANTAPKRLTLRQLRKTLPLNWEVVETWEGRFIFIHRVNEAAATTSMLTDEGSADRIRGMNPDIGYYTLSTWIHPNASMDPATYELPSLQDQANSKIVFEALSYAWGDQHFPATATVEDTAGKPIGSIKLGGNLATALEYLRYEQETRTLWVDAICINQNDEYEKSAQVLRMSSIYRDCSRVVIWLGPKEKDTEELFSSLARVGRKVEWTTSGFIMASPDSKGDEETWYHYKAPVPFSDDVWLAIATLSERPWFHRVWTVQEAVVANRFSIVQSSDLTISWPLFRRGTLGMMDKENMPSLRIRSLMKHFRSITTNPFGATLADIFKGYQFRRCLDPHDKVYGVLAVLPPSFVAAMKPDYKEPVEDLYKFTFLNNIRKIRRWEIRGCPRDPEAEGCPSWVPDLSRPDPVSRNAMDNLASGCSSLHFEYEAPSLLKVVGIRFDTIKTVSKETCKSGDDGKTVLRIIRSWEPQGDLNKPYPGGETFLDAFAATMIQDSRKDRRPATLYTFETIKSRFKTELLSTASDPISELDSRELMHIMIWNHCQARTMMETERGSIGLGCAFARPGDIICVLLGCDFPVLLRPLENDTWKYISECYVWDLESSKGLLGPLPSPWEIRIFHDPTDGARSYIRYLNTITSEMTEEDPRLGPLEGWQRISRWDLGRDLNGDDPFVCDFFKNVEDDTTTSYAAESSLERPPLGIYPRTIGLVLINKINVNAATADNQATATEDPSPLSKIPLGVLVRSVALTTVMANRWLLRPSLAFIAMVTQSNSALLNPDKNPVLNRILQWTIYNHFCAGNSIPEVSNTVQYIKNLGFHGIILGYSKDVVLDPNVELSQTGIEDYPIECYRMIDEWKKGNIETLNMIEAGDLLAVKVTGAGPIAVDALQAGRPMNEYLHAALNDICNETQKRGCQLWIDAEQQAMQPTLDDWTIVLMREHNHDGNALVYNTIQAYLKGARQNAQRHIQLAAQEGWTVGIKLVRGAYIENEIRSLIHDTKEDTDASYNDIADMLISQRIPNEAANLKFPDAALVLATHNAESAQKALNTHRRRIESGLPTVPMKCAQIMGMADELSCKLLQDYEQAVKDDRVTAETPRIYKCLPWGSVQECINYLYRRAVENRGAVERTQHMALAMRQELRRRILG